MKREVYLTILFDYYENLLTDKQIDYFKKYYFENLSLGEVADSLGVSRNAVFKQIKIVEKKLEKYEKVCKCYQKDLKIGEIINMDNISKMKDELEKLIN